jgi:hypothetical protein
MSKLLSRLCGDDCGILFFIIVFLLLFYGTDTATLRSTTCTDA